MYKQPWEPLIVYTLATDTMCGLQILGQLSEQVTLTILSRGSATLLQCITFLPPSLHPLALRAQHPSLTQHASLSLDALPPMLVHAVAEGPIRQNVLAAVATLGSQCTSLSLPGCWLESGNETIQKCLLSVLTGLTGLRVLELQDGLELDMCATLSAAVDSGGLATLQRLAIAGKPAQGIRGVMQNLVQLPALQSLCVTGLKRDSSEVASFCAALQQMTALTKLELPLCFVMKDHWGLESSSSNLLGRLHSLLGSFAGPPPEEAQGDNEGDERDGFEVTRSLGEALSHLKLLKHATFPDSFNFDYIEPVLNALAGIEGLSHLSLARVYTMESMRKVCHNYLPAAADMGYGHRFVPMLHSLTGLVILDLSSLALNTDVAPAVAHAIVGLTNLTSLQLTHVGPMTSALVEAFWGPFAEELPAMVSLQTARFGRNSSISDSNVGRIIKGLAQLPRLSHLELNSCKVRVKGAKAVAEQVLGMSALTLLDLRHNRIGPESAKALADSLSGISKLQKLRLTYSCIGVVPTM